MTPGDVWSRGKHSNTVLKDDLIALGLRSRTQTATFGNAARAVIERLLLLLRDFIVAVDLADSGPLRQRIEACRDAVASASESRDLMMELANCMEACHEALARIEAQRLNQKKEIATLVAMVHEAMAIVSGDVQTFNADVDRSMERFEALIEVDDLRHLKARLVQEVAALRTIAEDRRKSFETTCEQFNHKVEALERQLSATALESALDPLTGTMNRRGFDRACSEWLATPNRKFVLGIVDIDNFKKINDTHGHLVGDRAIIAVANTLKASVRGDSDIVSRFGGDEFAVLIAGSSLRQVENRMRMLASGIRSVTIDVPSAPGFRVSLSCGLAECSAGDTAESLIERADAALYEAKRLGKNRVCVKETPTLRDLMSH